jgi:hypothetical protein
LGKTLAFKAKENKKEISQKSEKRLKETLIVIASFYLIFFTVYGCACIKSLYPTVYEMISGLLMAIAIAYVVIKNRSLTFVITTFLGSALFLILVEITRQYIATN